MLKQRIKSHVNLLLPGINGGIVIGISNILFLVSYGVLIFSGPLSEYVFRGIGLMLFGAFVIGIITTFTSSFRSTIATPHYSTAAVIAFIAAAITITMPITATSEQSFYTVTAVIALISIFVGVFFFLMGVFKLGYLIRFIPYPVVGGFLAGVGWLIVKGAINTMTGITLDFSQLTRLFQFAIAVEWIPCLIFALLLLFVLRRHKHFLILPSMIIVTIILFYIVLFLTNTSLDEARESGWLFQRTEDTALWQPFTVVALSEVNWTILFGQIGNIGSILIISVISFLLNATGLELAVNRDIDLNRELQSVGLANFVAGFGCGPVGCHTLVNSTIAHKMGSNSRLPGIISAVICGTALFFGAPIISYYPKPVIGGLLLFLGLSFIIEWIYDAWFRLPIIEYILVNVIFVIIGIFGIVPGIIGGLFIAVTLFVVQYSRIDVVKHVISGAYYQSNVDRALPQRLLLNDKGDQLLILKLQGFIFFGTANNILEAVQQRVENHTKLPLRFVLLDFQLVNGFDSSALSSFIRIIHLSESHNLTMVLTSLQPDYQRQFESKDFIENDTDILKIFPYMDYGVEWCEDQILIAENALIPIKDSMSDLQDITFSSESVFENLMKYLEQLDVEKNHYIIHQGEPSNNLYYIKSGQVEVRLESDNEKIVRLRKMRAGSVVGELGLYLKIPASASVVASEPSIIYRLSINSLKTMEQSEPEIATIFHKYIVNLLSERLANTNKTIRMLLH
ncbi:MAG: SLC26A/SulP transporter family protein [Candidatus Latescibacteria bacterium]|nr:SLC26A/SulP transporter family protein [Candidatus Latescibacterota bacterium]